MRDRPIRPFPSKKGWIRLELVVHERNLDQRTARRLVRKALPGPEELRDERSQFEEWGRFLPEHSTAVSLLDRLLHHNYVVATDGESYRMRDARNRQGGRPSTT